jgi:predicted AAA+ superfamily ATPase
VSLLQEILLIKLIPAWSRNLSTRVTGTPKVAMTDSGIAANLVGADTAQFKRPGSSLGPLLQGFVLI